MKKQRLPGLKELHVEEISWIITILTFVGLVVKFSYQNIIARTNATDLSDFFSDKASVYDYKKNFIETQSVDRPPDEEDEPSDNYEFANRTKLIEFFFQQVLNNPAKRLYLILGEAGMGKTTFMINLFLKYNSSLRPRRYKIKFIPLGDPSADQFIQKYKEDGSIHKDGSNTILLLDAFDEDPKAISNYEQRLNQIVDNARTFRKVIITSRTQFFPDERKEKFTLVIPTHDKEGGYLKFVKKYIAPFNDQEIEKFLKKKYGPKVAMFGRSFYYNNKRVDAERLISLASHLVVRPMLLQNIDLLLNRRISLNHEYDVYSQLITSWIERESIKQPARTGSNFLSEMNGFILECARQIYLNYRDGSGLFIDLIMIDRIASENFISLDKIDLSTRSLLNRNTHGRFKFSHKSVLEYLLATIDAQCFLPEKMINFESFDFGERLRDYAVYSSLIGSFQQVFSFVQNGDNYSIFFPLNRMSYHKGFQSTTLFAVNFRELEIRKFRVFKNLKHLYLLDDFLPTNISELKLSKMLRVIGNSITFDSVLEVTTGNGQHSRYDVYAQKYNDFFFYSQKVNVYRVKNTVL